MHKFTKAALRANGEIVVLDHLIDPEAALYAARPRGIIGAVRADANPPPPSTEVKAALDALARTFEEFKAKNDQVLAAKPNAGDVVAKTELDKINAALGEMQASVDAMAIENAALKLNAGTGKAAPRDPEYTKEFDAYFAKGVTTSRLEEVRAAATKTDAEGGYLAPIEWDRTLGKKLKQISMMRQQSTVITISGAGFSKVFSDRNVGSGWVGEQAARPATATPALGSLGFPLGELYANPAATQGLIDDAEVDIEAWLADEVSVEFDRQEGIAFLTGDGTNKPHGILTYVTGAANAARHPYGDIKVVVSGAAAALTGDGLINLIYDLPSEYAGNAKLFLNRGTLSAARKLKDGQGNYLWQPSYQAGEPQTINGERTVEFANMPAVAANNIAALYGDMAETYLVVDRFGIRVLRDPFTNKPFVHFYTTKRVGGGVKNPEAMRALKISV